MEAFKKSITFAIPLEQYKALRFHAADRHLSMSAVLLEWITPELQQLQRDFQGGKVNAQSVLEPEER